MKILIGKGRCTMSRLKEKKIRKLRKKSIWPSILGLLFILCIFSLIILAIMASSCLDIVQRKINEGSDQAVRIAKLYEEYGVGKEERIQETILSYIDLSKDTEAVCIMDKDGRVIWSSNGISPDKEKVSVINLQQVDDFPEVRVILEEDLDGIFAVEGNELTVNDDIIKRFDILQLLNFDYIFSNQGNNSVLKSKIWFGIPANELDVFVLNNIQIYTHDLFMLAVSLMLIAFIISVFTLYYIISFISVIVSMRKTTKMFYTDMVTGGDNWLFL